MSCTVTMMRSALRQSLRLPASNQRCFSSAPTVAASNQRTALYDFHTRPEHAGKMVEFAGWDMPLNYSGTDASKVAGGPVAEHQQIRKASGLFDVGHMIQSTYNGPGALAFLSHLLPASLSSMPVPTGKAGERTQLRSSLSVLLNEEGGIIDDCMVTRWGPDSFYLVTNAGRATRDMEWISSHVAAWNESHSDKVVMNILSDAGLIALQGPSSHLALQRLVDPSYKLNKELTFSTSAWVPIPSLGPDPIHVMRGGYTGEDGFEISVPDAAKTEALAQMLVEQPEVKLAGLAARDSLRLEAGLCLYGHDLDEQTGVGEAALNWLVGKERRQPDSFIGAERTLKELAKGGCTRKRVGLVVEKGAPAREGARIFDPTGTTVIGTVTSGLPSPSVGQNISMGYIFMADGYHKRGSQVMVEVRKKMRKAEVVGMPWIKPGYFRGEE